jgi:hypothetical protein
MGAFAALGGLAAKGLEKLGGKIAGKVAGKAGGAKGAATSQQGGKQQGGGGKQSAPPLEAAMFPPPVKSMKKGGPVRKTGLYHLHKGEHVVPAKGRSGRKAGRKRTVIKA